MLGRPLKKLAFLQAVVSIFCTAASYGQVSLSCPSNMRALKKSSAFFQVIFDSSQDKAGSSKVNLLQGSSSGNALSVSSTKLPVSAVEQLPGIMSGHFPDIDLGTEQKYRYAYGGQATVLIPHDGKHVLRAIPNGQEKPVQKRQEKERELVARLRSKGLDKRIALPIHERQVDANGRTFIVQVFEKYDGALSDLYKTDAYKKLGFQQKGKLAAELAETIRQLHAAGLFHLDLKSDNILYRLKPDGSIELAVADIGLMRDPVTSGDDGAVRGTPFYISPTAIGGDVRDPRNDLYPLGVVFQELMTGDLVREAAQSEQARPKTPALPVPATDTAVFNWLLHGSESTPLQYHADLNVLVMPVQTRIAFPYIEENTSLVNRTERMARENMAVLGWFPFRNASEMATATAEAARQPEEFSKTFILQLFAEKPATNSSYNWKYNGPHAVQAMLSNDIFAGWIKTHADLLPATTRKQLLHELKDVYEAVQAAEKPGGSGTGTAGGYRVESSKNVTRPHLRLFLTDREHSFSLWFGRFLNGHNLEKLIAKLEPPKPK